MGTRNSPLRTVIHLKYPIQPTPPTATYDSGKTIVKARRLFVFSLFLYFT